MKIILSNKFYYRRGGDCIYMLNLEQMLKAHGHEVAVFSMQHPDNLPSEWSRFFPSEVMFKPGVGMIEAFMRPFGTKEVRNKFNSLINDFNPDVVHLNNIHSQLSPIIAEMAHKRSIRVVWTIHDQKLLCPRYDGLRNGKEFCNVCYKDKSGVLKYRCMKNSMVASWLAFMEAKKWNRERLEYNTDVFLCPSHFMANRMQEGGFRKEKINVLCNFIDVEKCMRDSYEKSNYYCYIGRLSYEKGIKTLIEAAKQLPYKLIVIGGGPLENELKAKVKDNIKLVGFKEWPDIKELVGKARFSVIPSEVNENNPLSVIEAQCLGTPVLGARIGGIPELIEENVSGMTFTSSDVEDLKDKIQLMWDASFDYKKIAEDSQARYNAENYYNELMKIYTNRI